jgi:carbon storage regulator
MLILSRKENESIVVGDTIEIIVCRVVGGRVQLGVQAPREVPIRRGELQRREADACDPASTPQKPK